MLSKGNEIILSIGDEIQALYGVNNSSQPNHAPKKAGLEEKKSPCSLVASITAEMVQETLTKDDNKERPGYIRLIK